MATDLLKANGSCKDEVDLVVESAVTSWKTEHDRSKKYSALLPLEKPSVEGPVMDDKFIDQRLAAEYPVVDFAAIMSKMRIRYWRMPLPFFAAYDVNDPEAYCSITYGRDVRGTWRVQSDSRYHPKIEGTGGYTFRPYPEASQSKILSRIRDWESIILIRMMLWVGCLTFAVTFGGLSFLAGFGWISSMLLSSLVGGVAATLCAALPGNDSDLTLQTSFAGVLPNDVREKILAVRDKFDYVAIVQEVAAKDWSVKKIPKPRNADPLVLAFKDGIAYFICKFMTTPAEHYMFSEFST